MARRTCPSISERQRRARGDRSQGRDERGKGWIDSIAEEYPTLVWIAELVAHHDAAECITELENQFGISLALVRGQVAELHAAIRAEIDKPRGKRK